MARNTIPKDADEAFLHGMIVCETIATSRVWANLPDGPTRDSLINAICEEVAEKITLYLGIERTQLIQARAAERVKQGKKPWE